MRYRATVLVHVSSPERAILNTVLHAFHPIVYSIELRFARFKKKIVDNALRNPPNSPLTFLGYSPALFWCSRSSPQSNRSCTERFLLSCRIHFSTQLLSSKNGSTICFSNEETTSNCFFSVSPSSDVF